MVLFKVIAWDLVFYFVVIILGIIGIIMIVSGVFPNIVILNQEITCRNKISNYCNLLVCGTKPSFDLEGCEKYAGSKLPSKEDCEKLGFKCK